MKGSEVVLKKSQSSLSNNHSLNDRNNESVIIESGPINISYNQEGQQCQTNLQKKKMFKK